MRYALCNNADAVVNVIELAVPAGGGISVDQNGIVTIRNASGVQTGVYAVPTGHSLVADPDGAANIGLTKAADGFVDSRSPAPVKFTPLQFIERFTEAEQAAISAAALANATLNLWLAKAMGAQEIDPADARTIAGMDALVGAGLITVERKAAILGQ